MVSATIQIIIIHYKFFKILVHLDLFAALLHSLGVKQTLEVQLFPEKHFQTPLLIITLQASLSIPIINRTINYHYHEKITRKHTFKTPFVAFNLQARLSSLQMHLRLSGRPQPDRVTWWFPRLSHDQGLPWELTRWLHLWAQPRRWCVWYQEKEQKWSKTFLHINCDNNKNLENKYNTKEANLKRKKRYKYVEIYGVYK